jgi:hypothetical protein
VSVVFSVKTAAPRQQHIPLIKKNKMQFLKAKYNFIA